MGEKINNVLVCFQGHKQNAEYADEEDDDDELENKALDGYMRMVKLSPLKGFATEAEMEVSNF